MVSQLGMLTPFFHKVPCGGEVEQAAAPMQTHLGAMPGPDLQYHCLKCKKFLIPADVVEVRPTPEELEPAKMVETPVLPFAPGKPATEPKVPPKSAVPAAVAALTKGK
jgi:hypothetical protein